MERGQLVRQAFQPGVVNSLERLFYGLAMDSESRDSYAFLERGFSGFGGLKRILIAELLDGVACKSPRVSKGDMLNSVATLRRVRQVATS